MSAAAAVLLASCTSHGDPAAPPTSGAPSPSMSPSSSPSSSSAPAPTASPARTGPLTTGPGVRPGEKPPVESAIAKQHTAAGALLFARYFIEALDWSIATNDTYLIEQVSSPRCTACDNYISGFEQLRSKNEFERGGRISVGASRIVQGVFRTKADYVIEFGLRDSGAVVMGTASPTPFATTTASVYRSLVFVSWTGRGWQVLEQGAPS